MIYEQRLTIPKLTTQDYPEVSVMVVHPGIVRKVSIEFPPGCCGLAHLQIWYWGRCIWPSSPNTDFASDTHPLDFGESIEIIDPPYEFWIVGWNEDDSYDHTPRVRIEITAPETSIEDVLVSMFGAPVSPSAEEE